MNNKQKLDKLQRVEAIKQFFSAEPNEAQFNATLEQLDDFIAAQLAGEDYEALFPEVAAYLNIDVRLAEIYDQLYQLAVDTRAGKLPIPSSMPEFNLGFLDQPVPKWLWALSLEHTMKWLRELFERPFLDGILDLNSMTPAMALRGAEDENQPRQCTYYAEPYHLFLGITPGIVTQTEAQIDGNIMNEQETDEIYTGKVHLFREQSKLHEAAVDEFGFFGLDKVAAGEYSLLVALETHSIWIQDLIIP